MSHPFLSSVCFNTECELCKVGERQVGGCVGNTGVICGCKSFKTSTFFHLLKSAFHLYFLFLFFWCNGRLLSLAPFSLFFAPPPKLTLVHPPPSQLAVALACSLYSMQKRPDVSCWWVRWINHRQHLRTVQPMPCWDVCKRWLHQRPRYILRRYPHSVSGSSCDRVRGENVFCYSLLSSYLLPPSPLSFQPRRPCHFSRCDLPHCRVQPV